jgi:hypothetical protein
MSDLTEKPSIEKMPLQGPRLTEQERVLLYDYSDSPIAGVFDVVESQAVLRRLVGRCYALKRCNIKKDRELTTAKTSRSSGCRRAVTALVRQI